MTLDSKAKEGQVKGFVVNPWKDDVKVFDFSENDGKFEVELEQDNPSYFTKLNPR